MHKWSNTVNKTQTFATCYFCSCIKEYRHFGYVYYQHGNNTTLYSPPECRPPKNILLKHVTPGPVKPATRNQ